MPNPNEPKPPTNPSLGNMNRDPRDEWPSNEPMGSFDIETRGIQGYPGHKQKCYYCGELTNDLAGDPGKWSVILVHPEEPGIPKWHHIGCVSEKLLELDRVKAERDALEKALRNVYAVAKRENRKPDKFKSGISWAHIIRFCTEAGFKSNILRDDDKAQEVLSDQSGKSTNP